MVKEYKCARCGKLFKRKYYYDNHIFSTGTPCGYTVTNTINGKVLSIVAKKTNDVVIDQTTKSRKSKNNDDDFFHSESKLKNCGNDDTTNINIAQNAILYEIENFSKNKNMVSRGNEKKISKNQNENCQENEEKKSKKIKPLNIYSTEIHNHINTQIINHNEITENINITNNNLNIYQSDKLNAFGKENLDYLTPDIMDKIIENPNGGIVNLIRIIHFNPDAPENRNVVIKNKKEPYFDVYNGNYWEKQEKDTAIHNLISTKKDIMDDHFETMVEKKIVNSIMKSNYNDFSVKLDPYLNDNIDKLIEEKLNKNILSAKCENLYKKLYGKVMLIMMNDKEINKALQRKLNKLPIS